MMHTLGNDSNLISLGSRSTAIGTGGLKITVCFLSRPYPPPPVRFQKGNHELGCESR